MGRDEYIQGVRVLMQLLQDNPELPLPFDAAFRQTIFIDSGPDQIVHALAFVEVMHGPFTTELEVTTRPEVQVVGSVAGLRVMLRLYLDASSGQRVTNVYRASDGSIHEVLDWSVPAQVQAAILAKAEPGAGE